jgi:uncharacterized membrane protein
MMQNFAYEIAAAFFLAALLMGGSFLRGFFSQEILRVFKLAAVGLVLAGAGIWLYHSSSTEPAPVQAVNPAPDPVKQEQQKKRVQAVRDSDRKALQRAIAEDAAQSDAPAHIQAPGIDAPSAGPATKNRAHKIADKVGQALHVVKP